MTLHAAAMRIELRIPEARSLKSKRRVLQSLLADVRTKMSLSAAEIDHQDEWQRSSVGVAFVGSTARQLEHLISVVVELFDREAEVDVLEVAVSYLEDPT